VDLDVAPTGRSAARTGHRANSSATPRRPKELVVSDNGSRGESGLDSSRSRAGWSRGQRLRRLLRAGALVRSRLIKGEAK
jgi:hypothetical protein